MIEALCSERDLMRRLDAREASRGIRSRIRCKHCHKKIPEDRRIDAVYCSSKCQSIARRAKRNELRTEMRRDIRLLTAPSYCDCGNPLDNRPGKSGPIGKTCKKCRDRKAQATRRKRLLEGNP